MNYYRTRTLKDEIREHEEMLVNFQINPFTEKLHYDKTGQTIDDVKAHLKELKDQAADIDLKMPKPKQKKTMSSLKLTKLKLRKSGGVTLVGKLKGYKS